MRQSTQSKFIDIAVRRITHSYRSGPFIRCLEELRWKEVNKPLQLFTMMSNNGVYCPTLYREDGGILCMIWGNELYSLIVWLDITDTVTYVLVKGTHAKSNISEAKEISYKESVTLVEYWATWVNQGEPKVDARRNSFRRRAY